MESDSLGASRPESSIRVNSAAAQGVNLAHFDNRAAFDRFHADPRFLALGALLAGAAHVSWLAGTSVDEAAVDRDVARRPYMVEIARFGLGGEQAYRSYEAEAEPIMRAYGYHVERVLHMK